MDREDINKQIVIKRKAIENAKILMEQTEKELEELRRAQRNIPNYPKIKQPKYKLGQLLKSKMNVDKNKSNEIVMIYRIEFYDGEINYHFVCCETFDGRISVGQTFGGWKDEKLEYYYEPYNKGE